MSIYQAAQTLGAFVACANTALLALIGKKLRAALRHTKVGSEC